MGDETVARLVTDALAVSEAELIERNAELETDNRALRETLHEAVAMLYRTNVRLDRANQTIIRLHQALRDARDLSQAA